MARFDADSCEAALDQRSVQPFGQRAGLDANELDAVAVGTPIAERPAQIPTCGFPAPVLRWYYGDTPVFTYLPPP